MSRVSSITSCIAPPRVHTKRRMNTVQVGIRTDLLTFHKSIYTCTVTGSNTSGLITDAWFFCLFLCSSHRMHRSPDIDLKQYDLRFCIIFRSSNCCICFWFMQSHDFYPKPVSSCTRTDTFALWTVFTQAKLLQHGKSAHTHCNNTNTLVFNIL